MQKLASPLLGRPTRAFMVSVHSIFTIGTPAIASVPAATAALARGHEGDYWQGFSDYEVAQNLEGQHSRKSQSCYLENQGDETRLAHGSRLNPATLGIATGKGTGNATGWTEHPSTAAVREAQGTEQSSHHTASLEGKWLRISNMFIICMYICEITSEPLLFYMISK